MTRRTAGAGNDALSPDFLDFIVCLNEQRAHAVLVGGYALGVHGVVRATGDIDFLYRRTTRNVQRLCRALVDFGAPNDVIDVDALMTRDMVTQFGQPPYRIDLLSAIDGVTFAEVWKGASMATVDGQDVRIIGLRELEKNKLATGRTKDKEDVRRLRTRRSRKNG